MLIKILIFILLFYAGAYSGIDVYIRAVKEGRRIDVGISKFYPKDIKYKKVAEEIEKVLTDDLMFTRLFNVVTPGWRYLPNKEVSDKWLKYGIDVVVCGEIDMEKDEYVLYGTMYDLATIEKISEHKFKAKDIRYLSHIFADNIVLRFTGEYGIATTRIVFVNDMTGNKEIYVIDYDGYNLQQLTNDKSINLYPRVSPSGEKILFTTYKYQNPDLFVMDITGKNKTPVSETQGLNVIANWSPDEKNIVLTKTMKSYRSPNLYLIDLSGTVVKQLTKGDNINISGYFSPNNREIVFVSDRVGYPQIYISDIDGINIRRLPTDGYVDSPVWSPKGDKIVFSMRTPGSAFYDIYLYDIVKNDYYRLTYGDGSNEHPYFSPDGRFIVFSSSRYGKYELFTMFLDGSNQRRIASIKGSSKMPCWTPRRIDQ